jgi:hypothetical protein
MALKGILISVMFFIHSNQTNLDTFISVNRARITIATSYKEFLNDVRFNAQTDCPDLILIQFSKQGKQLSAKALTREDMYHIVCQRNKSSLRNVIYFAVMKNCVYMWANTQKGALRVGANNLNENAI